MKYKERRKDLLRRLASVHGAVRVQDLCLSRSDRRCLLRMVEDGSVERHPQGVVSVPGAGHDVIVSRRLRGVVTCAHALARHGLPLRLDPGPLHVAVPRSTSRVPTGIGRVTVHRVAGLVIPGPARPPVADPLTALLCFMRCAEELDVLIALDAALRDGLISRDELVAALPGSRNAPLRALLARADPRARSLLETVARYDLQEAGQDPGVAVDLGVEVDLVLRPRLVVETDGFMYHSSLADWTNDHLRDQRLNAAGWTVLRLTSRQVLDRRTVEIVRPVASRLGCWVHPAGA